MMSLLTFVISAVVMGLVVTSPAPLAKKENDADKRSTSSCHVDGYVYYHGEVFTRQGNNCIKYRCEYGTYRFIEEACEWDGQCYAVGSVTDFQCRSFRCDASDVGGGYTYYSFTPVSEQKCKDYYGQCRGRYESFHYAIHGRLWNNCHCQVSGDRIHYSCNDRGYRPVSYNMPMVIIGGTM